MNKLLFLSFIFQQFLSISAFSQPRFLTLDSTQIWINTLNIEGRKAGEPLVVFESGHGTPMGNWDRVIADSANLGPMFTYDRPGVGKSEPIEEIPTLKNVADRLLRILDTLDLAPPYVLVGHSLGGVLVRGFAVYYPEKLAGLVIIDPGDFTETQANKREYYEVLGWDDQRIDQEFARLDQLAKQRDKTLPPALVRERQLLRDLRATDFLEITAHPLPNIPVHILTGGRFDVPPERRAKDYDQEVLFHSKMRHRVARWTEVIQSVDKGMMLYSAAAGHLVHWDAPELAITSIKIVLQEHAKQVAEKVKSPEK